MRRFLLLSLLLSLCLWSCIAPLAQSSRTEPREIVARFHFVGLDQLKTATNATTLNEIWTMPETAQLRAQIQDKLARALAAAFQARPNRTAGDRAALIRPLLDDLLERESYVEVNPDGDRGYRWTLAIQLPPGSITAWETNCSQLLAAANLRDEAGTNRLSYVASNSWFVLTSPARAADDSAISTSDSALLGRIKDKGRPVEVPKEYLLKAEIDLAQLRHKPPFLEWASQPQVELTLTGKGARLKSELRLVLAEPISWRIEKWEIPTHIINDPQGSLISFTGLQGIAPWLSRQPVVRDLGVDPVPNQFFAWGDSHAPLQIQAAAPVKDVTNLLAKLGTQWVPKLNSSLSRLSAGELQFRTNQSQLLWHGLPIMPYLRPAREPRGEFLSGGVFPLEEMPANPPPAELLEQLTGPTNLLYYDWEITQDRLTQLRHLALFLPLFLDVPNLEAGAASYRWLDAVGPKLGNAVTEVSAASPREIRVLRNSQIGFNGLELMALAYWFESTNFPRMNFKISFRPPIPPRREAAAR